MRLQGHCNKCGALRLGNIDKVKYNDIFDQITQCRSCDNILPMTAGAVSAGRVLSRTDNEAGILTSNISFLCHMPWSQRWSCTVLKYPRYQPRDVDLTHCDMDLN